MKPDGDTMETTEPTDAVAEASSSQDSITEQAPSQPEEAANGAAARADPKANGKPAGADPKVNAKCVAAKTQPAAKSAGASGSRPGTASQHAMKPFSPAAALKKTAAKVAPTGVVPKRPAGGVAAASTASTVKNQSRGPDKRPFGPARATAAAPPPTATNSSKPTANGIPKKRPGAEAVNVTRAKAPAPSSRAAPSSAPKAGTSTASKAPVVSVPKTARPAPGPSTSRAAFTSRAATSTVKSSTAVTAKTPPTRVTAAPSTGRTAAAQPPRTAAAKKDVSRPTSAVAKKPAIATTSAATKKPAPSKPTATLKLNSASKSSATEKAADPKMSPSNASQPVKPSLTKKPAGPFWLKDRNRPPLGQTPPTSPASKPVHSSTLQVKCRSKPMQAVPPFNPAKKTGVSNATKHTVEAQRAARGAAAAAQGTAPAAALAATQTEATEPLPQAPSLAAPAPEDDHRHSALAQETSAEAIPVEPAQRQGASSSPPRSPVRTTSPRASPPLLEQQESNADSPTTRERTNVPVEPALAPAACPPNLSAEAVYLNQTPSTSQVAAAAANAIPVMVPHTNLNEDDDEEEREGSQLVSVSEMSGTTQPTEDSRPDSAGPVVGSHWRAGGALLSELDSEDVSGSQQGASELSAPGVLEGTESMDDLGDGSLKGAIDMEGASAGSPDFEKVPDIPANDFDEDDEEDDRVCDMDVGSERADKPQRLKHDNNVEGEEDDVEEEEEEQDEEDEDVEMASEGVTESGLESYGNADEDDFAEDERLDNLNRVAEPPAPPLLPSGPAAQWHQPNPFADPWAEPLQPLQGPENSSQPEGAAASPLEDADPDTPTRAGPDCGLAIFDPDDPGVPHRAVREQLQSAQAQMSVDESGPAPLQTLAPGMSVSSTLSSDTSTPEELCDNNGDGRPPPGEARAPALPPQPDPDREEAEARPPSAGAVQPGPASNPSSPSVTEDEASDTEGEALLDDSLESPAVAHATFDGQPPAQRCLSTVEEAEEAEGAAGFDTTPPSATSLASYGFDTMTTASNSNAQSTGESCVKSPGIFSLEELSDETKEACPIPSPPPPRVAEHNYIDCGTQQEAESAESFGEEVPRLEEAPSTLQPPEESPDDTQPPYYSICEKTENSFAGFAGLPHRREHSAHPRSYGDIVKPHAAAAALLAPPKLTCADLPPRSPGRQALSPQLRRLEQHQRQLLEMQQRRDQQSRPLEEAEQERRRREEEEARRKKEEAEEEIKRNEEALARRRREEEEEEEEEEALLMQQELKERQQIMQWQQELQQSNQGQAAPLSPSSGLCTIYEALEASDDDEEEVEGEGKSEGHLTNGGTEEERETPGKECLRDSSPSIHSSSPPPPDSAPTSSDPSQDGDSSSPESPERSAVQELDWGKKVDIVQQLINQTLLLNRDGCSSLLVLPGGGGGTLSPLESSLWPSLLPPLTPPSATVTSVSSFSPEATGSSPQGEWTVVELETHH